MGGYTREEMIETAQAAGPFNDRLLSDWTARGLLDSPSRSGLGRGRGREVALWPEEQRHLLVLLQRKRPGVSRLGALANIPVALWLYWGDHYVPTRQARRATRSWAHQNLTARSVSAARTSARTLLSDLAHPDAVTRDMRRAEKILVALMTSGTLNRANLVDALGPVINPPVPQGARPLLDPEAITEFLEARSHAARRVDQFTEVDYRAARTTHHASLAAYLQAQPGLEQTPDIGRLFDRPDLEQLVNRACLDVITHLGLNARRKESDPL